MTTLIIILLIAFVLLIAGITILEYCFADEVFESSTVILTALAGSLFITGCANLWMQREYEADKTFSEQWLVNPDSQIEVTESEVILAIEKTVTDIKGQEHTFRVSRTISMNNAHLLGIISGEGKPLPNYHGYFFLIAGIIAGLLVSKTIRNLIEERRMANHYRRLSPSTSI